MTNNLLSTKITLPCGVTLKNRLVKSAMTERISNKRFEPTTEHEMLYKKWADCGAGLLITGNVMIDRRALEGPRNVVVEDERHMDLLRRWADAGQSGGCRLWMQISHPGRQTPTGVSQQVVAPSAVPLERMGFFFSAPRQLGASEIEELIGFELPCALQGLAVNGNLRQVSFAIQGFSASL